MSPISVIIVTWNRKGWLTKCLDCLKKQTVLDFQTVVVDNASDYNIVTYLNHFFPWVHVIRNKENLGYTKALEIGIRNSSSDLIVELNDDVEVEPDWLEKLVEPFSDKNVGASTSLMLFHEDSVDIKGNINASGGAINFLGFAYPKNYCDNLDLENVDSAISRRVVHTEFIKGGASCIRREAFERVGGFNSLLNMYMEDVDLSFKLSKAGYKLIYVDTAVCYHRWNFKAHKDKFYMADRARLIMLATDWSARTLIIICPALLVMELGLFLLSIKQGWFRKRLSIYKELVLSFKELKEVRRELCRIRTVPDRTIMENYIGAIEYKELSNPVLDKILNPILNVYWKIAKHLI